MLRSIAVSAALAVAAAGMQDVHKPGPDVTVPAVVSEVKPAYTPEAMRDGITGSALLVAIVEVDGSVSNIRILRSLDPGLDGESAKALSGWRFKPGTKNGQPVRVEVEVEMTFTTDAAGPRLDSKEVYRPGQNGVTLPAVRSEAAALYPEQLRGSGVGGTVRLECVVLPNGRVSHTRVARSVAPAVDAAATRALKQWRFEPGKLDNRAVPVAMMVEIEVVER
jgi:TonB family protein